VTHPFEQYGSHHERNAEFDRQRFESSRVEFAVRTLYPSSPLSWLRRLRQEAFNSDGRDHVTFDDFLAVVDSFPYLMHADTLDRVALEAHPAAMLPALFRDFRAAPFVRKFDEVYEVCRARAARLYKLPALVFPRKGVKHGMVVVGSDESFSAPPGGVSVMDFCNDTSTGPRFYRVCLYRHLLAACAGHD
jgi:hypothetical protein